jgi:hypothetical protein
MANPNTPIFPTEVATDLNLMVASNRALSTLTYPTDSVQTQFTVVDGTKFIPPCLVQIDTEIILVGEVAGNILQSCVRGFSLTSSASHGQNADVKGYVLSYHHNQVAAEIKAIESALGANLGNVVLQTDQAGGELAGVFTNMHLINNGVTAGTYGGFSQNIIVTVDDKGLVTSVANATGNVNYPIIYKGAINQGSNAILGFSFGNTNAPNAVAYVGTSGLTYAVAEFTQGNSYWVQDHFYLPDDWKEDTISLDVYWRCSAITGNVIWKVRTGFLREGVGPDLTWNSYAIVTDAVQPVTLQTMKSRITPIPMTGFQPGDELFFQFARDAGDTAAAAADMISIKFNINRNFALGD